MTAPKYLIYSESCSPKNNVFQPYSGTSGRNRTGEGWYGQVKYNVFIFIPGTAKYCSVHWMPFCKQTLVGTVECVGEEERTAVNPAVVIRVEFRLYVLQLCPSKPWCCIIFLTNCYIGTLEVLALKLNNEFAITFCPVQCQENMLLLVFSPLPEYY